MLHIIKIQIFKVIIIDPIKTNYSEFSRKIGSIFLEQYFRYTLYLSTYFICNCLTSDLRRFAGGQLGVPVRPDGQGQRGLRPLQNRFIRRVCKQETCCARSPAGRSFKVGKQQNSMLTRVVPDIWTAEYPAVFWFSVSGQISGFICRISDSSTHKIVDIVNNDYYFFKQKNGENREKEKEKNIKENKLDFLCSSTNIFNTEGKRGSHYRHIKMFGLKVMSARMHRLIVG